MAQDGQDLGTWSRSSGFSQPCVALHLSISRASLLKFQGDHWKTKIREKRPDRALEELGGPSICMSLGALLSLFCLSLAFPWPPWESVKPA